MATATKEPDETAVDTTSSGATPQEKKESFFTVLRGCTREDWEKQLLYLYRLEPMRPGTRRNPNILCTSEPIFEDTIKQRYGSGVYHLILNRKNGPKYKMVSELVFDIEDPMFPPVLPGVDGWEADPANKRWAWAKKDEAKVNGQATLDRQGETTAIKELAAVTQQLLARGSAMSETERKILMDANAAAIDIVKERSKGEGKGNDIGSLVSALVQLQALIKPAPATDPLALMTQLVGLVKEIVPKTPPPAATGATGLSGITEFAQAVTAMREAFGPEATGAAANPATPVEQSGWEKAGNMLVNLLAPAMAPLGDAIGHLILTKTGQPGQPAIRPNLTPTPEVAAGVPAIPEPQPSGELTQEQTMMIVVAQKIAAAFEMNVTGDSFAEVFEQQQGSLAYDAVVSVPAEERLKQLQAVPQAWAILQRFEKALPEFMAAFYEYGKGEPEGGEPVPIDEGPAKRTRGKK